MWRCGLIAVLLLALAAVASDARAGAMPRERGEVFLSLSQRHGTDGFEAMVYGEYGPGGGWTLGLDAASTNGGAQRAMVFGRRPIGRGGGPGHRALSLGLGAETAPGGGYRPVLRPGFHWGYGFARLGPGGANWRLDGWAVLDIAAELRAAGTTLKADATLGLRPSDRLMLIWQVQSTHAPGVGVWLYAVPSVAIRLRADTHLTLGLRQGVAGSRERSVQIGTWLGFRRR